MPVTTSSPSLTYAEETLGVHQVYEEALALNTALDELLTAKDKALDEKRNLEDEVADRKINILIEERGKHPDESQAAMDRHLKEVYHKDEELKRLQLLANAKAAEVSGIDLDIEYNRARRAVAVARMNELGGYFQFLAVTKLAQIEARKTTPTQPATPTQPEEGQQ
jgi:hypothetical protein